MPTLFKISKLTDRQLIGELVALKDHLLSNVSGHVQVLADLPSYGQYLLADNSSGASIVNLEYVFEQDGYFVVHALLRFSGHPLISCDRSGAEVFDTLTLHSESAAAVSLPAQIAFALFGEAQKRFKVSKLIATIVGEGDNSWDKYRRAQAGVIQRLQNSAEELIVKAARNNSDLEAERAARFEKLEAELREQLQNERIALEEKAKQERDDLKKREDVLVEKERDFDTKDSFYVARQKRDDQMKEVKGWLEKWDLTKNTHDKRRPIFWAYVIALVVTLSCSIVFIVANWYLMSDPKEMIRLQWWHWVLISVKVVFSLAGFTTFLIYFIRWNSAWAQCHADEEFRNRTLLIDIGRSSWLLEAVRDAQIHHQGKIPDELLRELSRNLFAGGDRSEVDLHPSAIGDVLLQGLSSLKVKVPGGPEVEATREGKK